MPARGEGLEAVLGPQFIRSEISKHQSAKLRCGACFKGMFVWAAILAALFILFIPPCSASNKSFKKENKKWIGRLKYGTKLNLRDLEEWSAVLPDGKKVTLDDLKEWSAKLKPGYVVIEVDPDKYKKRYGIPKKYIPKNFNWFKAGKSCELNAGVVQTCQWVLKDGNNITSAEVRLWQGKLKLTTFIIKRKGFSLANLLAYRSSIGIRELTDILGKHKCWLEKPNEASCEKACFCGADLRGVNLRQANLRYADFRNADLRGADLIRADLRDIKMNGADLREAIMYGAELRKAKFRNANMRGMRLMLLSFDTVDMGNAELSGANFWRADLSNTILAGANLSHVKFEGVKELPLALSLLNTRNLWQLVFDRHSYSLQKMRSEFKKAGLPSYARQVNHASCC